MISLIGVILSYMKKFLIRILYLIIGTFFYALGIVITIRANIGYAPWDVFHVGLSNTTGITIGFASIAAGTTVIVIVTLCKEKIGLGTVLSMISTGGFIDLIISLDLVPLAANYIVGIVMLIIGLFVISFGTYFYINSALGAGPRDNLMVVMKRKTKLPVGVCRSIIELSVTLAGWLLGGMVGLGTVISVFMAGLSIQVTFTLLKFDVTAVKHETFKQTWESLTRKKDR